MSGLFLPAVGSSQDVAIVVGTEGAADDTAAIEAAIAAHSRVYLPGHIYRCNLTITKQVELYGRGSQSQGYWALDEAYENDTRLTPNDDAEPIIHIQALHNVRLRDMTIVGNGAGTTGKGVALYSGSSPGGAFPGNGLEMSNCWVGDCTYPFYNYGGCNMVLRSSAFVCGNLDIFSEGDYANSILIQLCSVGGTPATGNGRCFQFNDASIVNIVDCEQGAGAYDYLGMGDPLDLGYTPVVTITGGNWESFSSTGPLCTVAGGILTIVGGRFAMSTPTALVRYTNQQYGWFSFQNANIAIPFLFECPKATSGLDGDYAYHIEVSGGSRHQWMRFYTDDTFTTVAGQDFFWKANDFSKALNYGTGSFGFAATGSGATAENHGIYGYGRVELYSGGSTGNKAAAQCTAQVNEDTETGASLVWSLPFTITFVTSSLAVANGSAHTGFAFRLGGTGIQIANSNAYASYAPPTTNGAGFMVINGTVRAYTANGTTVTNGTSRTFAPSGAYNIEWKITNDGAYVSFLYREKGAQAGWTQVDRLAVPGSATVGNVAFALLNDGVSGSVVYERIIGDVKVFTNVPR